MEALGKDICFIPLPFITLIGQGSSLCDAVALISRDYQKFVGFGIWFVNSLFWGFTKLECLG